MQRIGTVTFPAHGRTEDGAVAADHERADRYLRIRKTDAFLRRDASGALLRPRRSPPSLFSADRPELATTASCRSRSDFTVMPMRGMRAWTEYSRRLSSGSGPPREITSSSRKIGRRSGARCAETFAVRGVPSKRSSPSRMDSIRSGSTVHAASPVTSRRLPRSLVSTGMPRCIASRICIPNPS